MLPLLITSEMPEDERARWRLVRLDTFADLCPGGLIMSADTETGNAMVRPPAPPNCPPPADIAVALGPNGLRIIPK